MASRRSIGFAANPIPLSEIQSYVEIFGRPTMPMNMFIDLLGIMDMEYLSKIHTKNQAKSRGHHKPPGKR